LLSAIPGYRNTARTAAVSIQQSAFALTPFLTSTARKQQFTGTKGLFADLDQAKY
jgi:hypothetical protein